MKSKYYIFLFCGSLLVTGMYGCKKEVQVGTPITQLVTTSVFNDNSTATAALLSLYAQMITSSSGSPWCIHRTTGLLSDELTNYFSDQYSMDLYTNALNANIDGSNGAWTDFYSFIYQANAILENLQGSTGVSLKVKQQLSGEAYFMRAYCYFYLVDFYGDVPLVTSTDYKVNAVLPRTPQSVVYQQMVSDLKQAQTLLNSNYVDASDTTVTNDRIRPTSWAATALLARVYLYMGTGHYSDAESQATTVINNTQFQLLADLTKVFGKNSREAIWQMTPSSSIFPLSTLDGYYFILNAVPGPALAYSSSVSPQLFNAFETGDQRKTNWISSYSSGGNIWYYPYKYRNGNSSTTLSEYTMMLRLGEQYLIRAEARTQQGNMSGALTDLNIIRNRAGLVNYAGATDQTSLLTAIAHERQVELFTEGDRWFDLKRTKTVDAIMGNPGGVCAAKGGSWNTAQQLYPIPPSDIRSNTNLLQNPGY